MARLEELLEEEEQFSLELFLAPNDEWFDDREPRERKVTFDSVKQRGASRMQDDDLVSGSRLEAFCSEKWVPFTTDVSGR